MTKETVIIVHGSFAAPKDGVDSWYAPGSEFCRGLDERLERGGSPARCWAHLEECGEELRKRTGRGTGWFWWNGNNNWLDRTAAARLLGQEISHLVDCGWRCHIIAHSHGGNVVLELLGLDRRRTGLATRLVFLGTPLLTYASRNAGRNGWRQVMSQADWGLGYQITGREDVALEYVSRRKSIWLGLCVLIWVALFALVPPLTGLHGVTFPHSRWLWVAGIGIALGAAATQVVMRFLGKAMVNVFFRGPTLDLFGRSYWPQILFLNSERDEAYNFLASVLHSNSPFVEPETGPRPGLLKRASLRFAAAAEEDQWRYPIRARWLFPLLCILALCVAIAIETARPPGDAVLAIVSPLVAFISVPVLLYALLAVRGTVTAILLPWRAFLVLRAFVLSAVRSAIVRHVRRRAWRDLQGIAFGVVGSPHRIEDVGVHRVPPDTYSGGEWVYEALDPAAEQSAIEERKNSVWNHVERLLSEPDADLYDVEVWRNRVGTFASSTRLVHTAYYRHPASLDQIARHFCKTDEEIAAAMEARHAAARPS